MSDKETLQQAIETLNTSELREVSALIDRLKKQRKKKSEYLKTYDLGGKFDHLNVREQAYD